MEDIKQLREYVEKLSEQLTGTLKIQQELIGVIQILQEQVNELVKQKEFDDKMKSIGL